MSTLQSPRHRCLCTGLAAVVLADLIWAAQGAQANHMDAKSQLVPDASADQSRVRRSDVRREWRESRTASLDDVNSSTVEVGFDGTLSFSPSFSLLDGAETAGDEDGRRRRTRRRRRKEEEDDQQLGENVIRNGWFTNRRRQIFKHWQPVHFDNCPNDFNNPKQIAAAYKLPWSGRRRTLRMVTYFNKFCLFGSGGLKQKLDTEAGQRYKLQFTVGRMQNWEDGLDNEYNDQGVLHVKAGDLKLRAYTDAPMYRRRVRRKKLRLSSSNMKRYTKYFTASTAETQLEFWAPKGSCAAVLNVRAFPVLTTTTTTTSTTSTTTTTTTTTSTTAKK